MEWALNGANNERVILARHVRGGGTHMLRGRPSQRIVPPFNFSCLTAAPAALQGGRRLCGRVAPGSRPLSRRLAIHGVHGPAGVARYQMVSRLGAPSLPEPAANAPALPVEACGASAHHSDPIHGRRRGRRQGRVATCSRRRAVATGAGSLHCPCASRAAGTARAGRSLRRMPWTSSLPGCNEGQRAA